MFDGVYLDGEEAPVFVPARRCPDKAVLQIVETSACRIICLCTKRGLLDDTAADSLADEEHMLLLPRLRCEGSSPPGHARVSVCDGS